MDRAASAEIRDVFGASPLIQASLGWPSYWDGGKVDPKRLGSTWLPGGLQALVPPLRV